jgi:hypothetical protein
VSGGEQTSGAIHVQPIVVAVTQLSDSGVERHAYPQRHGRLPDLHVQGALPGHGRVDGLRRGGEHRIDTVARAF